MMLKRQNGVLELHIFTFSYHCSIYRIDFRQSNDEDRLCHDYNNSFQYNQQFLSYQIQHFHFLKLVKK